MDDRRFDDMTRALATSRSRRGFLGTIAASVAAAFTGAHAAAKPKADKPSKCYGGGSRCTNGKQCCSGTCTNRQCAAEIVPEPECTNAANCPASPNECTSSVCIEGVCRTEPVADGTPISNKTVGDCQRNICDGAGGITSVADDSDLPEDGNPCTQNVCIDGVPSHPLQPTGTSCGQSSFCNEAGACEGVVVDLASISVPDVRVSQQVFGEVCLTGPAAGNTTVTLTRGASTGDAQFANVTISNGAMCGRFPVVGISQGTVTIVATLGITSTSTVLTVLPVTG